MENRNYTRYRNVRSIIHAIDPITKFLAFILLIIATFVSQSVITLSTVFIFTFVISFLARVRFKSYFRILLFIIPFYLTMLFFYWLALHSIIDAAISVAYMSVRLYLFLLISIIFTSTTREMDMVTAIDWWMTPLRLIKVPTYEISMMIMLAIRFIPLMFDDLRLITVAQTSRGVNIYNGTFKTKVKGIFNSLLPMFVLSFKRADDVSNAMILREYEIGKKRTKYKKSKFGILEVITILTMIALFAVIIYVGLM